MEEKLLLVVPPFPVGADYIDYPELVNSAMLQLAGALRGPGRLVHLMDALSRDLSRAWPQRGGGWMVGAPWGTLLEPLEGADFDGLLVLWTPWMAYREVIPGLFEFLDRARSLRPAARIGLVEAHVGGMHHIEVDGDAVLAAYPQADFFLKHEAETTMLQGWRELSGVVAGEPCTSLDDLPLPAWDLVDTKAYDGFLDSYFQSTGRANLFRIGPGSRPVLFSRGCPFGCSFCTSGPPAAGPRGRRYRPLSLDRAVELMKLLKAGGADHLVVLDDAANLRKDFGELLSAMVDQGLQFDFPNGLRADHLTPELVELYGKGGGVLSVSAETASDVLRNTFVGKNLSLDSIRDVARWSKESGVKCVIHWMVGLPGETRDQTRLTLETARDLLDDFDAEPLIQYAAALPGARMAGDQGVKPGSFPDPAASMAAGPTVLPEGVSREELMAGVELIRQRAANSRPQKVIVNLTYRCNNHCRFCAVGNRIKEDLPVEEIKTRLLEHRKNGIELLDLDGGEPSLHPNLISLIKWAKGQGFRNINVTTNGRTLAYPEFASKLMRSGLNELLVSVHGVNREIHEELTAADGSFKESMTGIANALKFAPEGVKVGANTTLTRTNYQHLDAFTSQLFRLGIRKLNIQFLTPFGRADREIVPDPTEAAELVKAVIDRWKGRMTIQVINLPFCYLKGYEDYLVSDIGKLGRKMLFVTREEVNLFHYLAGTRHRDEDCRTCLLLGGCDGKYSFEGESHV